MRMSANMETENRALNAAELEMVNGTRSPAIEQKTWEELKALVHRLRQAHSRAHDLSARQQREMRGKAEPHGARRAQENAGNVDKTHRSRAFPARGKRDGAAESCGIRPSRARAQNERRVHGAPRPRQYPVSG